MKYYKTFNNIYRTRHTNMQTFIQMRSLTHTYNEITEDVQQYTQDRTHKHTRFHKDAFTHNSGASCDNNHGNGDTSMKFCTDDRFSVL